MGTPSFLFVVPFHSSIVKIKMPTWLVVEVDPSDLCFTRYLLTVDPNSATYSQSRSAHPSACPNTFAKDYRSLKDRIPVNLLGVDRG
jgi:hypothetical protein